MNSFLLFVVLIACVGVSQCATLNSPFTSATGSSAYFGRGLYASDDKLLVGSPNFRVDGDSNVGRVDYYTRQTTSGVSGWSRIDFMVPPTYHRSTNMYFGNTIDGENDLVAVGAYGGSLASVMVYNLTAANTTYWGTVGNSTVNSTLVITDSWLPTQLFRGVQYFGYSVAMSRGFLAVGSYGEDGRGQVYLFPPNPIANVSQPFSWTGTLLRQGDVANADDFGWSLSMWDDVLVVGSKRCNSNGNDRGCGYIFHQNSGGTNNWGMVRKITTVSPVSNPAWCGSSAATNGFLVALGCPRFSKENFGNQGGALVLTRVGKSDTYSSVSFVQASNSGGQYCGESVGVTSYTNNTVFLGCPSYSYSRGRVAIINRHWSYGVSESWGYVTHIYSGTYERLGYRIASPTKGGMNIFSASGYDTPASNAGRIHLLKQSCGLGLGTNYPTQLCSDCAAGKYSYDTSIVPCYTCPFGSSNLETKMTTCNITFAAVSSISPPSGLASGGTQVTIQGTNFNAGLQTFHFVDGATSVQMNCTGGSTTQKVCTTPSFPGLHVRVTQILADTTIYPGYTPRTYSFYNATFTTPSPSSAHINAQVSMSMRGSRMLTTGSLFRCRWRKVALPSDVDQNAVFTRAYTTDGYPIPTSTSFTCITPDVTQTYNTSFYGTYRLEVSFNNQQYQYASDFWFYDHDIRKAVITPAYGLNTGLTRTQLIYPGLVVTQNTPVIRFRDSNKRIRYATNITVEQGVIQFWTPDFTKKATYGPNGASPLIGLINVQDITVSLNGRDYSGPYNGQWNPVNNAPFYRKQFTLLAQVDVSTLTPGGAPSNTVPTIAVFGGTFYPTNEIRINATQFGIEEIVQGAYINSGQIAVTLPTFNNTEGIIWVSVALNGQQFSNAQPFNFFRPCDAGWFSPDVTETCRPCPAGTFKTAVGDGLCINCPEDTFCAAGSTATNSCPQNTFSAANSGGLEECGCKNGFYNPDGVSGQQCVVCPRGAVCEGQIAAPFSKAGYWNSGSDFVFTKCNVAAACIGGKERCAPGYHGRLCSSCDKGYYQLNNICVVCPENSSLNMIFSILLLVIFLIVVRKMGVRRSAGTLAMGVALLQMTALMGDFQLRWPPEVLAWFSILTIVNLNIDIAAPECNVDGLTFATKYKVVMLMPFITAGVLFILFLLECLRSYLAKKHGIDFRHKYPEFCAFPPKVKSMDWKERGKKILHKIRYDLSTMFTEGQPYVEIVRSTTNAYLLMMSLLYITMTNKTVEMFSCTQLGTELVLNISPDIECWTPEHMELVYWAIVSMILWVIGTPLIFWAIVHRYRHSLLMEDHLNTFGVLYDRYRQDWYWFEVVNLGRKGFFIVIKVFLIGSGIVQGLSGQVVLLASCLMQVHAAPYRYRYHNVMAMSLLVINFFILVMGVAFLAEGLDPDTVQALSQSVIGLLVTMMIIVVIFVLLEKRSIRSKGRFRRELAMEERILALEACGAIPPLERVVRLDNLEIEEVAWQLLAPEHIKKFNKLVVTMDHKSELLDMVHFMHDNIEGQKDLVATHERVQRVKLVAYEPVKYAILSFLFSEQVDDQHKLWIERLFKSLDVMYTDSKDQWNPLQKLQSKKKVEADDLEMIDLSLQTQEVRKERKSVKTRIERKETTQNLDSITASQSRSKSTVAKPSRSISTVQSNPAPRSFSTASPSRINDIQLEEEDEDIGGMPRRTRSVMKRTMSSKYNWVPDEQGCVAVNEGDELNPIDDPHNDDNWVKVENRTTGQTGFVPTSYVDVKEEMVEEEY